MLDKIDYRLLWHLDNNARLPVAELARHIGVSRQTCDYRLEKLLQEKVLLGFIASVDIHRIGYLSYRVYYRFRSIGAEKRNEIFEHLILHPNTLWVVTTAGEWDMEVVFVARNFVHFNNLLKEFHVKFGHAFARSNISMSPVSYHFKRDYLIGAQRAQFSPTFYGFEPRVESWDETDFLILDGLSKNCRCTNDELAEKIGVAPQTLRIRLQKLEAEHVIPSYRILIDLPKISRSYFKLMLAFESISEKDEKRIYNLCAERNFVIYLTEVLGDWQMELEVETSGREEVQTLLDDVRSAFPHTIRHYEILEVTRELKINYFPMGAKVLSTQTPSDLKSTAEKAKRRAAKGKS